MCHCKAVYHACYIWCGACMCFPCDRGDQRSLSGSSPASLAMCKTADFPIIITMCYVNHVRARWTCIYGHDRLQCHCHRHTYRHIACRTCRQHHRNRSSRHWFTHPHCSNPVIGTHLPRVNQMPLSYLLQSHTCAIDARCRHCNRHRHYCHNRCHRRRP